MRRSLLIYSKHSRRRQGPGGCLETWSPLEKLRVGGD